MQINLNIEVFFGQISYDNNIIHKYIAYINDKYDYVLNKTEFFKNFYKYFIFKNNDNKPIVDSSVLRYLFNNKKIIANYMVSNKKYLFKFSHYIMKINNINYDIRLNECTTKNYGLFNLSIINQNNKWIYNQTICIYVNYDIDPLTFRIKTVEKSNIKYFATYSIINKKDYRLRNNELKVGIELFKKNNEIYIRFNSLSIINIKNSVKVENYPVEINLENMNICYKLLNDILPILLQKKDIMMINELYKYKNSLNDKCIDNIIKIINKK